MTLRQLTPSEMVSEAVATLHEYHKRLVRLTGRDRHEIKDAIEREAATWTIDPTPVDLAMAARSLWERITLIRGRRP